MAFRKQASLLWREKGNHSMRVTVILAIIAIFGAASCNRSNRSAAQGSAAPIQANVGPIPGGVEVVNLKLNPYATDAVALQDGRRLFDWYNCSGCHGGHAGGGMGPSLRDETWTYGNDDTQIFDSIAQGRSKGMPAWGTKIPEDQIWQLVAYIKSMRTPEEPDPPVVPADEMAGGPGIDSPVVPSPHNP
jgi:cytochrome c oxidase cbb3-type subunit III